MDVSKNTGITDNIILTCLFIVALGISVYRNSVVRSLQGVIWSDVEGYYMYLPAVFIYKDIHAVPIRTMDFRRNDKGEVVMKYTCGVAFFYLPFFLVANAYAHIYHYDTSGFSVPYYYGMIVCGVFWGVIGWFLLKKILYRFFSRKVTWITLISVLLGTNFFHYSTREIGMSHIYSFALAATLLLSADNYYKRPRRSMSILSALLMGWLILIRPTNCVMIIFILLFNVVTLNDFKQRVGFLKEHATDILVAIPFLFIPFIPQMIYWNEMVGHLVDYSYSGEGFINWRHPKIFEVLFDPENGLFLYAPILFFSVFGLFVWRKDKRTNFISVSLMFIIITYLFASWWQWSFGAAYGHRCYIEYFPFFAFPMAMTFEKIVLSKYYFIKTLSFIIVCLFIYYSVRMSLLYDTTQFWGGPHWRGNYKTWADMTKRIF